MGALEDDASDILRKARSGRGLGHEDMARSSGVARDRLLAMESGADATDDEWRRVAAALDLAEGPLIDVARARWQPAPPDPTVLRRVETVCSLVRGYEVRCYLLGEEEGGDAVLFDCGVDADAVLSALHRRRWRLEHLLVTHGHGDHVGALDAIAREAKPANVVLPSPAVAGRQWSCGSFRVEAAATPGHTADSVSYVVRGPAASPWLCAVGDLLFAGSLGGAGHDYATLLRSVRDVVLALPDETALLPGHGPMTTVGQERRHNPFLASAGPERDG